MSTLREVLRSIRKGQKTPPACPRCGAYVRRSRTPLEGWILPARYLCPSCGYEGFVIVEAVGENTAAKE